MALDPKAAFVAAGARSGNVNVWSCAPSDGPPAGAEPPSGVLEAKKRFTLAVAYVRARCPAPEGVMRVTQCV